MFSAFYASQVVKLEGDVSSILFSYSSILGSPIDWDLADY